MTINLIQIIQHNNGDIISFTSYCCRLIETTPVPCSQYIILSSLPSHYSFSYFYKYVVNNYLSSYILTYTNILIYSCLSFSNQLSTSNIHYQLYRHMFLAVTKHKSIISNNTFIKTFFMLN